MMDKLNYLIKTLSRTKRKDYENYVVNAIWNRIDDPRIIPVTQQYIKHPVRGHYFIDLYFPQLNIGIECNESYHLGNREADTQRAITIFDVLSQVKKTTEYIQLEIDVTKGFEEVKSTISNHVAFIKNKIQEREQKGERLSWDCLSHKPHEYYEDKDVITTTDNIPFRTLTEVDNIIFGKNSSFQQHSYYQIADGYFAWFPKLAINGHAVARNWHNEISSDGKVIREHNTYKAINEKRGLSSEGKKIRRVTFAQTKNPVSGKREYRFVGVFCPKFFDENHVLVHEKVSDEFPIIRKRKGKGE